MKPLPDSLAQLELFEGSPEKHREVLRSGRREARALAERAGDDERRMVLARAFCRRVAETYWQAVAGPRPVRPLPLSLPDLLEPTAALAERLGRAAADAPPERVFFEVGRLYNVTLPATWRARYGVYYTPPELADRLLDRATDAGVDWRTCRVLDPACGGGAFVAPVARRMTARLSGSSPDDVLRSVGARLRGYEIDPFAAWLSQLALDAVLLPFATKATPPSVVRVCDTLSETAPETRYDLVVGNPPYGRVRLGAEQRDLYRRGLYGHANLYALFTDVALRHTLPGGVVAFVTPTSFLAGSYFKNLRTLLAREAPPVSLDFVDTRKGVFEDVLQETLLAVYRKDASVRVATACTVSMSDGQGLRVEPAGPFALPAEPSEPWMAPRSADQSRLLERVNALSSRLRDWGYAVSTGPLVWNRHKDQLRGGPGPTHLPLIWAEAVANDGSFIFRAEKKNHEPFFALRAKDDWLVVRKPCVLVQRTTAKEQRRRLIAAELPAAFLEFHGGAVVENHLNMVWATGPAPRVPPRVVAAFLNSEAADRVFRCVSGSVAVSAFELEALPLPSPEHLSHLCELVAQSADPFSIDEECARLYGWTD